MAVVEDLAPVPPAIGDGAIASDVADLIARAGRLSPAEAHALAGAVEWSWQPLALPVAGSFAANRGAALSAARAAGRAAFANAVMDDVAAAALASPGGRSTARHRSWAENGLAAVLVGVVGAVLTVRAGLPAGIIAFGLLAIVGAAILLVLDRGAVTRRRLTIGAESAALALVVRDIASPEAVQALRGPWSTVVHD